MNRVCWTLPSCSAFSIRSLIVLKTQVYTADNSWKKVKVGARVHVMSEQGIFDLRCHNDLFRKLQDDLRRVKANPENSWEAFDFFITAYHIWDWKGWGGKKAKSLREKLPQPDKTLIEVCRQLCDGSKHFEVTNLEHASVKHTKLKGSLDPTAFDSGTSGVAYLSIRLEDDPAKQLGVSSSIRVDDLAERMVKFWETWLDKEKP